ncbi:MAG: transcription antitermination factor NusB [Planctomycetota bacterium]
MPSNNDDTPHESARRWAARMLIEPAERFPHLHPPRLDNTGLSPADAALGLAIYRTTLQRWLTLEYILDKFLQARLRKLDPMVQAVLLSGAAQLLFMDRLPGYAVVDQAVGIARGMGARRAAGMTNAVLRKVAGLVGPSEIERDDQLDRSTLPRQGGGKLHLKQPVLPPVEQAEWHLSIAASIPRPLLRSWVERYGMEQATAIAMQSIENPPTIVAVEPGFEAAGQLNHMRPHNQPGFYIWSGPNEAMRGFLQGHPIRRVQDPAASLAVESTRDLSPRSVLDYCAGRGTKTRQLALAHADATVFATDVDRSRLHDLTEALADFPNACVISPDQAGDRRYDLILLDVPCSNTGVLARRPEARYRYSQHSLGELVQLQRSIVDRVVEWIDPTGGHLLYSTCSIERPENRKQVDRLVRRSPGGCSAAIVHEHQQLPGGTGDSYADGSYHALVRFTP